MIKNKIKQFVFTDLSSQNIEISGYTIKRIGIQGPPKTTFYFNGNQNNIIEIGSTGIFELDLLDTPGDITKINFKNIENFEVADGNERIIVDILYQQYENNGGSW